MKLFKKGNDNSMALLALVAVVAVVGVVSLTMGGSSGVTGAAVATGGPCGHLSPIICLQGFTGVVHPASPNTAEQLQSLGWDILPSSSLNLVCAIKCIDRTGGGGQIDCSDDFAIACPTGSTLECVRCNSNTDSNCNDGDRFLCLPDNVPGCDSMVFICSAFPSPISNGLCECKSSGDFCSGDPDC